MQNPDFLPDKKEFRRMNFMGTGVDCLLIKRGYENTQMASCVRQHVLVFE